jgi:hypothetical protein
VDETRERERVFVTAPRMLNDLHGAEIHGSLERALLRYARPDLLVIDDFAVRVVLWNLARRGVSRRRCSAAPTLALPTARYRSVAFCCDRHSRGGGARADRDA